MEILQPSQPNLFINGMMELWQRGTAQIVAAANGTYITDRWRTAQTIIGSGPTLDQSADVPSKAGGDDFNAISLFSYLYTGPAADVFTATEFAGVMQIIEGYNFSPYRFSTFAMTFKIKASLPGIYSISIRNDGSDASYIAEYTINSANTWEEKTIFIKEVPPLTLGTWNFINLSGLKVEFVLDAGSTFRTSQTEQWVSGNFRGSANSVAFFENGGETFQFCDVMFTPGPYAIPVARAGRNFVDELTAALRYFENLRVTFGSDESNGGLGAGANGFTVKKRDIPTITYTEDITFHINSGGVTLSIVSTSRHDETGISSVVFNAGTATTRFYSAIAHVDAEL